MPPVPIPYARTSSYNNAAYVRAMADLMIQRGETAAAARLMKGQNTQQLLSGLGTMTMATVAGIGKQHDEDRDRAMLQAERDRDYAMRQRDMDERAKDRQADIDWRNQQFREARGKEFAAGTDINAGVSPGVYQQMVGGTASAGRFAHQNAEAERLPATPMIESAGIPGYSVPGGTQEFAYPDARTMSQNTAATPEQFVRTPDAGESLALANLSRQDQALRGAQYDRTVDNARQAAQLRQTQANADRTYNEGVRQFNITEARLAAKELADRSPFGGAPALGGATGQALLDALPPSDAALIKSIADYQTDLTKVTSLRNNEREKVAKLVMQYDPTFDMTQYGSRAALAKDFRSGKSSQNIRSLNTAVGHLDSFADAAAALNNTSWQRINQLTNWWKGESGDPKISKLLTTANAVEGELASVFKGTGATDQEIKEWRRNFNAASSPEQFKAVVSSAVELMGSRLQALQYQYETGMAKPKDFNILSPHSREILQKLGIDPDTMEPPVNDPTTFQLPSQAPSGGSFFDRQQPQAPAMFGPRPGLAPAAPAGPRSGLTFGSPRG